MTTKIDATLATLFLGTLVAAASWLTTYIVNNIVTVPTLEFKYVHDIHNSLCSAKYSQITVTNLSRTMKFSNLQFILRLPVDRSGKFTDTQMLAVSPGYIPREPTIKTDDGITFPLTSIHPKTSVLLTMCYTGEERPTFHITPQSDAVRPLESGFLTWLIRNEICVLFGLFAFWTLIVILVVRKCGLLKLRNDD